MTNLGPTGYLATGYHSVKAEVSLQERSEEVSEPAGRCYKGRTQAEAEPWWSFRRAAGLPAVSYSVNCANRGGHTRSQGGRSHQGRDHISHDEKLPREKTRRRWRHDLEEAEENLSTAVLLRSGTLLTALRSLYTIIAIMLSSNSF